MKQGGDSSDPQLCRQGKNRGIEPKILGIRPGEQFRGPNSDQPLTLRNFVDSGRLQRRIGVCWKRKGAIFKEVIREFLASGSFCPTDWARCPQVYG